jgi:hypothetical protein
MIFGLLLIACSQFASAQNVEGQIIAAQYGEFKVPGEKTGTFQFPSDVCQVSGGGKNFSAFATGRAVKIVDSDPNKTEIATPSSVFINQCSVNMATTYTHVPPYYLTSGTGGLQEAITANQTNNGVNSIILNWEWYLEIQPRSAATVIGSVTGITSLGLVDITTTPYTYYRWNGSQYVAIPTNGSVASVGLTAPAGVFGVTGSPVTVSGNLGLTLNVQAQNTALMGPCSGGSGAVGFRFPCAADIAQAGTLYNAILSGNLNGMMFPAQCGGANPPIWCSGTTPDAWVRAACTQLPSNGGFINFLGLTGNWAASAPCSTPTKQVIMLADNTSRINITETDGGIPIPLDNSSMLLGQGAGQCNFTNNGIHLAATANVTAIVSNVHTDGSQENFTADGLCVFGANGATVTKALIYADHVFTNTDTSNNNAGVCNTNCELVENVGGLVNVLNNWYNVTDGVFGVTGSALTIASSGGGGCANQSINISGTYEHANGGGPEMSLIGNDAGAVGCSITAGPIYTEKNVSGTPSTIGIKVRDCFNCTFANIEGGGGSGTSGDMINLSQSAAGRVQNVTFSGINNSFASWANTINDTTPGGRVIPFSAYQFVTFYPSNPGYIEPPVLPGTVIQSVTGDAMTGAGNFSTGSGTIGTNFGVTGCNVSVTCTLTRDNSTAPPGSTYSQKVQVTANADLSGGYNGVQYTPSVSFTAGTNYAVTFWGKGDGTFPGFPTFLLWNSATPVFYCTDSTITPFTTTWTLYSFTCTPNVSGTAFIAVAARTPTLATGTFWLGNFIFAPVAPLPTASLLTSVTPYGIGPATTAQQTTTLGTTAMLLGNTYTSVAGLALTTSSINGVTPTTGGSATTYLNGAGNYTTPTQTICSGTIALGTSAITSGTAATTVTATCTGLATTDTVMLEFSSSPVGVTGYGTGAAGALRILNWPTANTINVSVINNTGSSITPGAMTMNYRVTR